LKKVAHIYMMYYFHNITTYFNRSQIDCNTIMAYSTSFSLHLCCVTNKTTQDIVHKLILPNTNFS